MPSLYEGEFGWAILPPLITKAQWSPTKILIKVRTLSLDSAILIFTFCSGPLGLRNSVGCKIVAFRLSILQPIELRRPNGPNKMSRNDHEIFAKASSLTVK